MMKKPHVIPLLLLVLLCLLVYVTSRLTSLSGTPRSGSSSGSSSQCRFVGNVTGLDGIAEERPPAAEATPLDDVTITVKTSRRLEGARLDAVLLTWHPEASGSVYFVTDRDSLALRIRLGDGDGHVIATGCDEDHSARGLNCKMEVEFETWQRRGTAWWCHFDDDNYVNVDLLRRSLAAYRPDEEDVYLGRPSLDHKQPYTYQGRRVAAWFAHGGCGFCVSRRLARKMAPHVAGGELRALARTIYANDDCAIGFVVNHLLSVPLTWSPRLHSHFHRCELRALESRDVPAQISLSYGGGGARVSLRRHDVATAFFDEASDPSRLYTVHCLLRPDTPYCGQQLL